MRLYDSFADIHRLYVCTRRVAVQEQQKSASLTGRVSRPFSAAANKILIGVPMFAGRAVAGYGKALYRHPASVGLLTAAAVGGGIGAAKVIRSIGGSNEPNPMRVNPGMFQNDDGKARW